MTLRAHFRQWRTEVERLGTGKAPSLHLNSPALGELKDKEYRHGLVNAQIEVDLPLQIRALRKQLVGTQPELSRLTGMKQPRISAMEKPGGAHFTLETLRRLAAAFDVALVVRFAPFSEFLDWSRSFNPDAFRVPSFSDEIEGESTQGPRSDPQEYGMPQKWRDGLSVETDDKLAHADTVSTPADTPKKPMGEATMRQWDPSSVQGKFNVRS